MIELIYTDEIKGKGDTLLLAYYDLKPKLPDKANIAYILIRIPDSDSFVLGLRGIEKLIGIDND